MHHSWLPEETEADLTSTGIGKWNQFDANRVKFGIKSSYDENLYTKKLDKSSIPRSQIQNAEKLARAIESSCFYISFIHLNHSSSPCMFDLKWFTMKYS